MNRTLQFICFCQFAPLAVFLSVPLSPAQETNSISTREFSEFRVIHERNIFDPNRSARSQRGSRGEQERKPVVESFTLLGTMSYEKGRFAFFDGSDPRFKKVFKPEETIAGFKIAEITNHHVKLETNGTQLELRVGMQMKREDEGEWRQEAPIVAAAKSTSEPKKEPLKEEKPKIIEGESKEALLRLMKKRFEEK